MVLHGIGVSWKTGGWPTSASSSVTFFTWANSGGVQESSWRKTVELFGQAEDAPRQVALFPEEQAPAQVGVEEFPIVRVRVSQMALRRPRQWGACWLGCQLWEQLGLGDFWRDKLTPGREGTRWDQVLQTLVLYRLIDPGSEWRLHRHWFEHTALAEASRGAEVAIVSDEPAGQYNRLGSQGPLDSRSWSEGPGAAWSKDRLRVKRRETRYRQ